MQTEVLMAFKIDYDTPESLQQTIERLLGSIAMATGEKVECVFLDKSVVMASMNSVCLPENGSPTRSKAL